MLYSILDAYMLFLWYWSIFPSASFGFGLARWDFYYSPLTYIWIRRFYRSIWIFIVNLYFIIWRFDHFQVICNTLHSVIVARILEPRLVLVRIKPLNHNSFTSIHIVSQHRYKPNRNIQRRICWDCTSYSFRCV